MMSDSELLDRGEKLLWSGKPDPRSYAVAKGWLPFLIATGYLAMTALALGEMESGHSFAWYHVLFFMIGPAVMLPPVWYFFEAKRISYALTDRRAVIDLASLLPVRTSVPLGRITLIEMRPRRSGSGHLYFHHTQDPTQEDIIKTVHREGFVAVPEVHRVEQLLRKAVDTYKRSVAA